MKLNEIRKFLNTNKIAESSILSEVLIGGSVVVNKEKQKEYDFVWYFDKSELPQHKQYGQIITLDNDKRALLRAVDPLIPTSLSGGNSIERGSDNALAGTIGLITSVDGDAHVIGSFHVMSEDYYAEEKDFMYNPNVQHDNQFAELYALKSKIAFKLEKYDVAIAKAFKNKVNLNKVLTKNEALVDISNYPILDFEKFKKGKVSISKTTKFGNTSGYTEGTCDEYMDEFVVKYTSMGSLTLVNGYKIEGENGPFSQKGDSGALVLSKDQNGDDSILGVLTAKNDVFSVAQDFQGALDSLKIVQNGNGMRVFIDNG